jgi:lysophospholipase L1-like esterase
VVAGTITNAPTASGFLSVHRWGGSGQFVLQKYVDMTTPGKIYYRAYGGGAWGAWFQPLIVDSSVTTAKIADLGVTSAKIADGAVATAKIADGAVTAAKLPAGIIDSTKLSAKYDWVATITTGDVNSYTTQSGGWIVAGAMANAPTGSGWLFVHVFGAAGNFILQRWHDFTDPSIFWVRKQYGGVWSAWAKPVQPQVLPKTGKNVVCLGDSITENGDYPVRLATLTGATVTNCGFGGSRMAFSTGDYAYLSFHKLADYIASGNYTELTDACARLAGSPVFDDNIAIAARLAGTDWSTVDYLVAAYGTNDYGSPDVPLGVVTDTTGATFKGTINYAVNKICTAYPNIKILFVSPIYRSRYDANGDGHDSDTWANTRGNYMLEFVDAMKEMASLNKMPCIDMYRTSGINKYTAATLLSDGLHPTNGAGYQRVAEKVAAGLVANW